MKKNRELEDRIKKLEDQASELEADKRLDFMVKLYHLDDKELKRHINRDYRTIY